VLAGEAANGARFGTKTCIAALTARVHGVLMTGRNTRMKTPEEIKMALKGCKAFSSCSRCPYFGPSDMLSCKQRRNADALAYIQQLERERDAAVEDMTNIVMKYGEPYCEYCEGNDTHNCTGRCWSFNEGFKWRGVQKED